MELLYDRSVVIFHDLLVVMAFSNYGIKKVSSLNGKFGLETTQPIIEIFPTIRNESVNASEILKLQKYTFLEEVNSISNSLSSFTT